MTTRRATPSRTTTRTTDDPFAALVGEAKAAPTTKKTTKKKDRTHLDLTPDVAAAFDRFCAADATLKMAKGAQEAAKSLVLPVLTDKLLDTWCEEGHRIENPRLQTQLGQAILQAREILKFDLPANEEGEVGTVTDLLVDAGFEEDKAQTIRREEFTETTELRFNNITKLREDPKAKKVVDKLLKLVIENFTADERGVLLEKVNHVEVKKGFLDRVVGHVDGDAEKLKKLLNAVRPQFLLSHVVYNGQLADAVAQLGTTAGTTLNAPATPPVVFEQDEWRAVATGNVARLYSVGSDTPLVEKTCSGGHDHAKMTCQKWLRDDAYRNESIAKAAVNR
jgi:hypothetical protein